jgi:iron(III) transport system substrate-binding protein
LKRRGFIRLGLGALGAGALDVLGGSPASAAAPAQDDSEEKLYAEAKKEGKVVWWTSHYAQSAAEAVRDAFVAKYPLIEVQFIRQTAQVIYQRLAEDLKAGLKDVDVFCSSDESHYRILKKQNVLALYTPSGIGRIRKSFQDIDPDHTYHTGSIALVLFNHRADLTDRPGKWTDLWDEKWLGKITLGHPGFSGFVGAWVVAMSDKYGWDYFTRLARNKPKIGRSIFDTVTDIVKGDRVIGAGPDSFSLESKAKGKPIDISFPSDDSILAVSPTAIMRDAPHPKAARLFENFFYTHEYSSVMARTFNLPLRSDVAAASGVSLDKIKWYRNTVDRLEKGIPEAIARWRETFGV